FVASNAATPEPGRIRYMTPRYTSGMLSRVPVPSSCIHATLSWPTFCREICFSGLNRCASYVRLYISQSSGLGFSSISVVTGTNRLTCASGAADNPIAPMNRTATVCRIRSLLLRQSEDDKCVCCDDGDVLLAVLALIRNRVRVGRSA